MSRVVIGVDPHKRSATIEVVDIREKTVEQGRFGTDNDGYRRMLEAGRRRPDSVWAVGTPGAAGRARPRWRPSTGREGW